MLKLQNIGSGMYLEITLLKLTQSLIVSILPSFSADISDCVLCLSQIKTSMSVNLSSLFVVLATDKLVFSCYLPFFKMHVSVL